MDAVQGNSEERMSRIDDTVNERESVIDAVMRHEPPVQTALQAGRAVVCRF